MQVLLPRRHAAANVTLGFVHIQYLSYLLRKAWIDMQDSLRNILMNRRFAKSELLCGASHRGFVVDNIMRNLHHAFLYLPVFVNTEIPHAPPKNKLCTVYAGMTSDMFPFSALGEYPVSVSQSHPPISGKKLYSAGESCYTVYEIPFSEEYSAERIDMMDMRKSTSTSFLIMPLSEAYADDFCRMVREYLPGNAWEEVLTNRKYFPNATLMLLRDGVLRGCAFGRASKRPGEFVLDGIAVESQLWRNGYGSKLLAQFEKAANAYGFHKVSLGSAGGFVEKFYIHNG